MSGGRAEGEGEMMPARPRHIPHNTERKRVNDRPITWHVYYAGVRVGVIVERSGVPSAHRKCGASRSLILQPLSEIQRDRLRAAFLFVSAVASGCRRNAQ
jgi:hypothetical protein